MAKRVVGLVKAVQLPFGAFSARYGATTAETCRWDAALSHNKHNTAGPGRAATPGRQPGRTCIYVHCLILAFTLTVPLCGRSSSLGCTDSCWASVFLLTCAWRLGRQEEGRGHQCVQWVTGRASLIQSAARSTGQEQVTPSRHLLLPALPRASLLGLLSSHFALPRLKHPSLPGKQCVYISEICLLFPLQAPPLPMPRYPAVPYPVLPHFSHPHLQGPPPPRLHRPLRLVPLPPPQPAGRQQGQVGRQTGSQCAQHAETYSMHDTR